MSGDGGVARPFLSAPPLLSLTLAPSSSLSSRFPPPAAGAAFVVLYLPVAVDEAVRRDSLRSDGEHVGEAVIRKMAAGLEAPAAPSSTAAAAASSSSSSSCTEDADGGWDARHTITVHPDAPASHVASLLLDALADTSGRWVPPRLPTRAELEEEERRREAERERTAANARHRADLLLREIVAERARAGGKGGQDGKRVAAAKKKVLEEAGEWEGCVEEKEQEEARLREWLRERLEAHLQLASS